jgi:hypothetical protein
MRQEPLDRDAETLRPERTDLGVRGARMALIAAPWLVSRAAAPGGARLARSPDTTSAARIAPLALHPVGRRTRPPARASRHTARARRGIPPSCEVVMLTRASRVKQIVLASAPEFAL